MWFIIDWIARSAVSLGVVALFMHMMDPSKPITWDVQIPLHMFLNMTWMMWSYDIKRS